MFLVENYKSKRILFGIIYHKTLLIEILEAKILTLK